MTRKFGLACFFALSSTAALFLRIIDQGSYVALATLVLSIFSAANVTDKKLGGAG